MATNTRAGSATNRQKIRQCLRDFNFKSLFVEELGWDILRERPLTILVDGTPYVLRPLVEKRGVRVFVCDPDAEGRIPADGVLRQIEREVIRSAYEHFIIAVDEAREHQVWLWVKREQGKRLAWRIHRYHRGQSGELLAQKLEHLSIGLEEEERLQMTEVAGRVAKAFDVERVTKKFYDRFKREHAAFLRLISGIEAQADREWYASLMLNRLMFLYFIQRKGFLDTKAPGQLDGDPNYLSNRLRRVQQERGENQFHTFYRYFLLKLFHEGLSQREHAPELEALLGNVPYLNGGLFDVHVLERAHPEIAIPDEAFEQLFAFLDEFDWYLDDRPLRSDREINPDVLGYIFEKYINQKQMGAYYTKEDITEYISKNTIIPTILDATEQQCQIAFRPDGPVWSLLREHHDAYLYDALKKGCDLPLPPEIEVGVHDVVQRGEWNRPAPDVYALPTETWREVVARRTRYQEVREKLVAGKITSVNDLVTYNLDVRRFAEDVITYCSGTDLLRALYESIARLTVLDPTCGSGAFLFASLGILEDLYEACLERMEDLLEEREAPDAALSAEKRRVSPDLQHFRALLERVGHHPSRRYFIYKSIIINNLYGVDIMEEATEICKLRLFLKLVSQVERFDDIEPLPDIDFNIRAGNSLVGFASYEETKQAIEGKAIGKAVQSQMLFDDRLERIEQKAQEVERAFESFRALQTVVEPSHVEVATRKQQLTHMLRAMRAELNGYLASEYGIDSNSIPNEEVYRIRFAQWERSHQPFHWWVEFYGIMKRGGFDVVIGNPPWKEYSSVRKTYTVRNYQTEGCGNLHCLCTERGLRLRSTHGRMSYIVQLPLASSSRMFAVRQLLKQRSGMLHVITFDDRPGKLFEGLQNCRSAIFLSHTSQDISIATTRYQRWLTDLRGLIFPLLEYALLTQRSPFPDLFPKYANAVEERVFSKMTAWEASTIGRLLSQKESQHFIFYQEATRYWVKATVGLPYYAKDGVVSAPAHGRFLYLDNAHSASIVCALLNSSLFYTYFVAFGDCFHLSEALVAHFPVAPMLLEDTTLAQLGQQLMANIIAQAERKMIRTSDGHEIAYDNFYGAKSKPLLDEIDRVLARHYGFTDEELDFILNYDIKYRMGRDSADEDEE